MRPMTDGTAWRQTEQMACCCCICRQSPVPACLPACLPAGPGSPTHLLGCLQLCGGPLPLGAALGQLGTLQVGSLALKHKPVAGQGPGGLLLCRLGGTESRQEWQSLWAGTDAATALACATEQAGRQAELTQVSCPPPAFARCGRTCPAGDCRWQAQGQRAWAEALAAALQGGQAGRRPMQLTPATQY